MESLHGATGGKSAKKAAEPSEREGMAFAIGAAMLIANLRSFKSPAFWSKLSDEVKRCEGTERNWQKDDLVAFVLEGLFNGVSQNLIETWLMRKTLRLKGAELVQFQKDFVENILYSYLSRVASGIDFASAKELCVKANVQSLLNCSHLGGKRDWNLQDFINEEAWFEQGGKAGFKVASIKFLTTIASMGRPQPMNPFCSTCKELKFQHKGSRTGLKAVFCLCEQGVMPAEHVDPETMFAPKEKKQKRTGNMDELDPTGQGISESYEKLVCAAHSKAASP